MMMQIGGLVLYGLLACVFPLGLCCVFHLFGHELHKAHTSRAYFQSTDNGAATVCKENFCSGVNAIIAMVWHIREPVQWA